MMEQKLTNYNGTKYPIETAFQTGASVNKVACIPFIMAGYPTYEATIKIALTLQEAGADILEVGFPYSDPLADGPTIQLAHQQALKQGMSFTSSLRLIADMREQGVTIPIIIFSSYNPIFQFGLERFVTSAQEVGANGVLVPDLPFEEADELRQLSKQRDFALISLVAPTSKQRMKQIASQADGFLYCISSLGVTGERDSFPEEIGTFLEEVRSYANVPIAIGFGISKQEHVRFFAPKVDGVIIGSTIIKKIGELTEQDPQLSKEESLLALQEFIEDLFA